MAMQIRLVALLLLFVAVASGGAQAPRYDVLLRGGHVMDPRNNISANRDVAIAAGKIAAVAPQINPADAAKTIDVTGLHVIPGIVDIHTHVFAGTGEKGSYAGDNSLYPDGFTFRACVTTINDAGSSGWRNFEDFKQRIIDRSQTRVVAFLNIVGAGMRGAKFENDLNDMQAKPTADMAQKYRGVIVGVKTAHYAGPEWTPVERAVEAGTLANIPVMVDFGNDHKERPVADLVTKKLRPGDIYTHMYSGLRHEQDESGKVNPGLLEGRKRGVIFDVGHGGGSFAWRIAVPAIKEKFVPDSISSDLHIGSMNGGMKDMANTMSKLLNLGSSVQDVIRMSTWNPAKEIRRPQLGNLDVGADADIAVLRLDRGKFGFLDSAGALRPGDQKLVCELTLRAGKVVWDLNGRAAEDWQKFPYQKRSWTQK
jgi:dihydroorotase